MVITRILKFFDVPILEPSCRPSKGIGDDVIIGLGFEWKDGTWVKYSDNKFTFLAPSDDRPLNAVISADQLPVFSLSFRGQRRRRVSSMVASVPSASPLHHFLDLLPLEMLLFSSLWMRWGHSLCGRLSFSSSSNNLFMDSASSSSTSAFHIRFHLLHLHPHHLSSISCLYLDTPTFHLLHCVFFYFRLYGWLLCFSVYVFVLDDMDLLWLFMLDVMDLFWLIIMDYMDFLMLMDIFFTNVLVLRLWWLIGGAFILFYNEGGE